MGRCLSVPGALASFRAVAGGINIVYPAYTTPCITNFYDRLGRLSQVQVQGCQSVSFTSDLAGNPLSEIWSGGTLDGLTITNGYDQLLRRTNLWSQYSGTPLLIRFPELFSRGRGESREAPRSPR
jgi:hypothetical protein